MELTPRKRAILTEIVKAHIETGEPIGSKILATRLENPPSTATLRSEMSDLSAMGYLEQPHTSAGRLPTSKAYRLYVSELMEKNPLSDEGKLLIDNMLEKVLPDPESIGSSAAEILSELTGLPVISAPGVGLSARICRATLMPMGKGSAVVFVITTDGRTRSRLVRCGFELTPYLINRFEEIIATSVCTKDIKALDMVYLQSVVVSAGLDALSLAPLISCVFDMAAEFKTAKVNVGGTANLLSVCPDREAKQILDLLKGSDTVRNLLSNVTEPLGIVFGDDTEYSELAPTGMIVAAFGDKNELGRIAVIGPTRMDYETILPSVQYLAQRVGSIMTEVLKGLEE